MFSLKSSRSHISYNCKSRVNNLGSPYADGNGMLTASTGAGIMLPIASSTPIMTQAQMGLGALGLYNYIKNGNGTSRSSKEWQGLAATLCYLIWLQRTSNQYSPTLQVWHTIRFSRALLTQFLLFINTISVNNKIAFLGQLANFNMGLHQNSGLPLACFATQAGIPHATLATPVHTVQTAPPAQQPSQWRNSFHFCTN